MDNANYKELYHRALVNPMAMDGDTLSALIDRYPYAQALRVAQARKNYHDSGSTNGSALLFTGLPNWLYGHVMLEPATAESIPADGTVEAEHIPTVVDIETVIPDMDDSGLTEHPIGLRDRKSVV